MKHAMPSDNDSREPRGEPLDFRGSSSVRRLIVEWQGPIYHLAYRMLGNEADAADAAQEVFAIVLRRGDRYDPRREFRAWIYRVATREILKYSKRRAMRSAREAEAAVSHEAKSDTDPVEERELRRVVQSQIDGLDEKSRAPLVLHYFCGLTPTEVARTLELPRTTVRHRIERSLEALRRGLRGAGYPAVAAGLERWLATAPAPPLPDGLQASLLEQAARVMPSGGAASVSGTFAGIAAGGITMKKIALATFVAIACLVAGFGAGRISSPWGPPSPPEAQPGGLPDEGATDRDIVDRSRLDRALEELRDAHASIRDLESRNAQMAARLASSPVEGEAEARDGKLEGSGIDWSEFAESFAQVVGPLARILPGGPGSDLWNELSREEQASILEFVAACRRVGAQADSLAEEPFFDPVILGELLEAACGESLGLSPVQIASLRSLGETVLAQAVTSLDLATATPLEKHRLRREMVDALAAGIRVGLTEDQGIRFEEISPAVGNLLVGTSGLTEIGMEWSRARDAVAGTVEHQYALTPEQLESAAVQAVVSDYMDGARRILAQYGQTEEPPLPLDSVTRDRMAQEFFDLQLSMEGRVVPLLTAEQHAEALGRVPHVLRFAPGDTFRNIPMLGTMF